MGGPDAEALGRMMFGRQADAYDADAETVRAAWANAGVRSFWLAEATAVLEFLGLVVER